MALIPLSMVAYSLATSSENPPFTRMLDYYHRRNQESEQRNTLHIAAMEQAAADRHMFGTAPQDMTGVDLRYPEYVRRNISFIVYEAHTSVGLSTRALHGMFVLERAEQIWANSSSIINGKTKQEKKRDWLE